MPGIGDIERRTSMFQTELSYRELIAIENMIYKIEDISRVVPIENNP